LLKITSNGHIRPAIQEVEVTSEDIEEDTKPTSHKENEIGSQPTAELEKKAAPQEKTGAPEDNALKKYINLMHK
jgi:hypothetical protein